MFLSPSLFVPLSSSPSLSLSLFLSISLYCSLSSSPTLFLSVSLSQSLPPPLYISFCLLSLLVEMSHLSEYSLPFLSTLSSLLSSPLSISQCWLPCTSAPSVPLHHFSSAAAVAADAALSVSPLLSLSVARFSRCKKSGSWPMGSMMGRHFLAVDMAVWTSMPERGMKRSDEKLFD
jgi:hypothetical protein